MNNLLHDYIKIKPSHDFEIRNNKNGYSNEDIFYAASNPRSQEENTEPF